MRAARLLHVSKTITSDPFLLSHLISSHLISSYLISFYLILSSIWERKSTVSDAQCLQTRNLLIISKRQKPLKTLLITQQCVVYECKCGDADLCSGYTRRHLFQPLINISIMLLGNTYGTINDQREQFVIPKKCCGILDCLIYEMLPIRRQEIQTEHPIWLY